MGVATKSRTRKAKSEPKPRLRRVQIAMSEKVYARLEEQAEDIGVTISSLATMMVAQTSLQVEITRASMPDIMKSVGSEMGKRLPLEDERDA
jgi:hypothetical protein